MCAVASARISRKVAHMTIHDLPLARDKDGHPVEVVRIDTAFSVLYRLYEPIDKEVNGETVYTHVIDLDVCNEHDARDWMYAYNFRVLVAEQGDHRHDPVIKKRYRDYADWVVENSQYEAVKNTKGFDFVRVTFTDNLPVFGSA